MSETTVSMSRSAIFTLPLRAWSTITAVPAIPALLLLAVLAFFVQPRMISIPFLLILLRQAVPLGLVALGQSLPIVGRSIDLSIGGVVALVNVVLSMSMFAGSSPWLSIGVPLLIGVVVGAANALFIVFIRASAVVVTLGMSVVLLGLSFLLSGGAPGGDINPAIELLARGRIVNLPYAGICLLMLALVLTVVVRRSVFGHGLTATGGGFQPARLAGVAVLRDLVLAHVLCSCFAALAAIFLTGYIGTGTLGLGADLVMASVAAVVLGGTAFGFSAGGAFGVLVGAFALTFLANLLTAIGVDKPFQLVLQGAIIAGAAMLSSYRQ
ncbi:ABC transporter permease [Ensifer sp. YR511]|uniref:ABC transporter permease n=1 Tax=Ensifer sp. YR511 TaxID=1855294 RepID=UPI00088008A4|nr:ABC transporter permease [Ensifer sp. YR511]SDN04650.1 ribose transport system permease protein [Ensifer sp. YR511]